MIRRTFCVSVLALAGLSAFAATTGTSSTAKSAKPQKPLHIARGEKVNIAEYVVPGKTVIFDFYSDYCPPCVKISPELEKLHARRADLVVVKVDINRPGLKTIDWKSPVAQQYKLQSVPHFKIYGPEGKLQAEGDSAYRMIMQWITAS